MRGFGFIIIVGLVALLSGCLSTGKSGGTSSNYSENITTLRPKYDPGQSIEVDTARDVTPEEEIKTPEQDVTSDLDELLSEIIRRNETIDLIAGYTIQVYSNASRENAESVKSEIYRKVPEARPEVEWVTPNYKVWVGQYLEKIEAQKSYSELKRHFPQAILIPIKIPNTFPNSNN